MLTRESPLSDLGPGHTIGIQCTCFATLHCWSPGAALALVGPETTLAELARRFRCKECGKREARVTVSEKYTTGRQGCPASRTVLIVSEGKVKSPGKRHQRKARPAAE